MRWGQRRADVREAALRLIDVAETHGVRGGVAINAIVNDRSVRDGSARLWRKPNDFGLRRSRLAVR